MEIIQISDFLCVNYVSNAKIFLLSFLHFRQIYKFKNKRMIIGKCISNIVQH